MQKKKNVLLMAPELSDLCCLYLLVSYSIIHFSHFSFQCYSHFWEHKYIQRYSHFFFPALFPFLEHKSIAIPIFGNTSNGAGKISETWSSEETKVIRFLRQFTQLLSQRRCFTVSMQEKQTDDVVIQASCSVQPHLGQEHHLSVLCSLISKSPRSLPVLKKAWEASQAI